MLDKNMNAIGGHSLSNKKIEHRLEKVASRDEDTQTNFANIQGEFNNSDAFLLSPED